VCTCCKLTDLFACVSVIDYLGTYGNQASLGIIVIFPLRVMKYDLSRSIVCR